MATEIARCPVQPGRYPDDASSTAGQAFKDGLETLAAQPGFQRLYWGRETENPDVLRLFIDWDDVGAHRTFMASPGYQPFKDRMGQVLDIPKLQMSHVKFTPHPPQAVLSDTTTPATEIVNIYFPADYAAADQEQFHADMKTMVDAVERGADEGIYRASAGGWADELQKVPSGAHEGEQARVYVLLVGWESVAAHMAFRDTQVFKDHIHLLRNAKDKFEATVVHASCLEVTRGGGVGDVAGDSAQEEILNPQGGGGQSVKTRADGTTTKNDPGVGGVGNALKKERAGR